VARPAIAIALPPEERGPVAAALAEADLEAVAISSPAEFERLLTSGADVAVAILDGENDFDSALEYYSLLHDQGREIPALMVLSPREHDKLAVTGNRYGVRDEYFTRPYSPESLRWRIEAMMIRRMTLSDGGGPVIQTGNPAPGEWTRRASIVSVFTPKGGVGKTTIAINLAAALSAIGRNVLLVDADTVTGHVASSLGLEHVRTVVDAVADSGDIDGVLAPEALLELLAAHPSGLRVLALSASPIRSQYLEPAKVGEALEDLRGAFDVIVVDLHPDYDPLNRAIFERSDRILVPVTPDVPALRAAVQLREIADELGLLDRLAMIVNRANSGVSVSDMERTVGMPSFASIRSAGLALVKASNEGRALIDLFPKEKVTDDFRVLAERVAGVPASSAVRRVGGLRGIFGRREAAAKAS
jgi:Flp pilus assembly CpaE family ATPase